MHPMHPDSIYLLLSKIAAFMVVPLFDTYFALRMGHMTISILNCMEALSTVVG